MAVRSVIVKSECPYIKLWLGGRYAIVEIDFYECKGLNTPDLRCDVFKLFEEVVLARSLYWGRLLQRNRRLREAVEGFGSGKLSRTPLTTLGSLRAKVLRLLRTNGREEVNREPRTGVSEDDEQESYPGAPTEGVYQLNRGLSQ